MSTIIQRESNAPSPGPPPRSSKQRHDIGRNQDGRNQDTHADGTVPLADSANQGVAASTWQWLRNAAPTATVVAALVGLAVWGHRTGWSVPKFSTLLADGTTVVADWCETHGVPESSCVECRPELMPKGPDYGWCKEHGVHNCPLHHPEVAQVKQPPSIHQDDLERAARALGVQDRKRNNSLCKVYQQRVQFASAEAVMQAGVEVELVERHPIREVVTGSGEIRYDPTQLANLSSRAGGTVWRVEKNIGDRVRAGEVVAIVDAMAIGQAKGELVDALVRERLQQQTVQRLEDVAGTVVAGRRLLEAEAAYEQARVRALRAQQTLANLGLQVDLDKLKPLPHDEQMARLRHLGLYDQMASSVDARFTSTSTSTGTNANIPTGAGTSNLLPIRAPLDGVVVERNVVAGEVVDTSEVLFQVADTRNVWLIVNVPFEEADKLSVGQTVQFRPDGSQQNVTGRLSWISTTADRQTRMVQVRAELPNAHGRLRNETFGTGRVVLRDEAEAIAVPNEAVHWEGCCHVVFVRDKGYFNSPESPKIFHVRSVRPGAKNEKFTEIIAGVLPGEVVATRASDVLRAQLLKNNLGAGCCEVE